MSNGIGLDELSEVSIADPTSGLKANVTLDAGKNKLETLTSISATVERGRDSKPDTFFKITNAGAIGDTIRVQLAATSGDTSAPDRDIAAVDVTYTLIAADVGDELKLRDNVIIFLNAQANFNASLVAEKVKNRATVWIQSEFFSLSGEFYERPNAGDFAVSVTGTTTVTLGFDNFIARAKESAAQPDPDSPHLQSVFGISGSVTTIPAPIAKRVISFFEFSGSADMRVDGSVTPKIFTIPLSTIDDIFVTQVRFFGGGNGIKFGQFLSQNIPLTNGIKI